MAVNANRLCRKIPGDRWCAGSIMPAKGKSHPVVIRCDGGLPCDRQSFFVALNYIKGKKEEIKEKNEEIDREG